MDRSVFGSTIKTYGGKNKRSILSRTYRPSALLESCKSVFEDDDISLFDKLLNEDKTKTTFTKPTPQKCTFGGMSKSRYQLYDERHSSALKSVQNVKYESLAQSKFILNHNSNNRCTGKENSEKFRSRLFASDSDSSHSEDESLKCYDYGSVIHAKNLTRSNIRKKQKKVRTTAKNFGRIGKSSAKVKRLWPYRKELSSNVKPTKQLGLASDNKTQSLLGEFEEGRRMLSDLIDPPFGAESESSVPNTFFSCETSNIANSTLSSKPRIDDSYESVREDYVPQSRSWSSIFVPMGISTPRPSEQFNVKIQSSSSIQACEDESNQFDVNNFSAALQCLKTRISTSIDDESTCLEFFKLRNLDGKPTDANLDTKNCEMVSNVSVREQNNEYQKLERCLATPDLSKVNDQVRSIFNSVKELFVEAIHENSLSSTSNPHYDERVSVRVTSESNSTDSLPSSGFVDVEKQTAIEVENIELCKSSSESDINFKIAMNSVSDQSAASVSNFSNANEMFETIIQRPHVTQCFSETNQISSFMDSLLASVLNELSIHSNSKKSSSSHISHDSDSSNLAQTVLGKVVSSRQSLDISCFESTSLNESEQSINSPFPSVKRNDMSYCRSRYSGNFSRDDIIRSRKSKLFNVISTFEPVLEEKAEECESDDLCTPLNTETVDSIISRPNQRYFTERRKKRSFLPTVKEQDSELDEGILDTQNTLLCSARPSIYLNKGKKWRRSFITLKNIRDLGFNPDLSNEENKGRCWRQNIKNLINNPTNASILVRDVDESATFRTTLCPSFLSVPKETDMLNERSIYSRCSRFSPSVSIDSSPRNDCSQYSILDENSFTWLMQKSQDSFLAGVDIRAEDQFEPVKLPPIDFSIPLTARDMVLRYCGQSEPRPFEECFIESVLNNCRKIGEGVYGEVFLFKKQSKSSRNKPKSRRRKYTKSSVFKIIPIEGDQKVNGEKQKKFEEILSELVITIELSNLKNGTNYKTDSFAEVKRCWCVTGRYPSRLISLWEEYDREKGSDNDSPKIFKNDQLYVILELNDGGEDLESFTFNNAGQTLSVFKQVACALAVAEQAYKFEHRDLHWGNILVSKRAKNEKTTYVFGDEAFDLPVEGVKVTIIDYTLSRISINNRTLFNDIGKEPDLFTAEGDFQFEVYRLMKNAVNDIWDQYVPKTNVLWLYYLVDKLIDEVRYRRVGTKIHEQNFDKLKILRHCIREYESSAELVKCEPTLGFSQLIENAEHF